MVGSLVTLKKEMLCRGAAEPGFSGGAPKVVGRYLENRLDELMNMYFGIRYPGETG